MRLFRTFPLLAIMVLDLGRAHAASVKISDLPAITAPSTNTWIEVADMDAATKSRKYLLTNLQTVATLPAYAVTNYYAAPGSNVTITTNVAGTNVTWTIASTGGSGGSTNLTDSGTNVLAQGGVLASVLVATNSVSGDSGTFTTSLTVGGHNVLTNADGTANWTASGTTNSTLAGVASVNGLVATNSLTVGGTNFNTAIDGKVAKAGDTMTGALTNNEALWLTNDVKLVRDAAGVLAVKNSTAAQAVRIYGTSTDDSNYRRLTLTNNSSGTAVISANGAGTGATGNTLTLGTDGTNRWQINSTGSLIASTDNAWDIGATGARPKNILAAGFIDSLSFISTTGDFRAGTGNRVYFNGRSGIYSPADGSIRLANNAGTDFSLLLFGGTTSSFPALKRSGVELQARLADDSGNGSFSTGGFKGGIYTTTTNYTAAVTDRTILANGTTLTITLPTAVGATGQEYAVKLIAASTATVATTSSQNIDGATTYALTAQYKYVKVQSDGTQWWIVANN